MRKATGIILPGTVFAMILTIGLASPAPRYTVFPQMAVGGGWTSDFYINNQGVDAVRGMLLRIFVFDAAGQTRDVQVVGRHTGTFYRIDLNPGETTVLSANIPGTEVFGGYAELHAPAASPLRATMVVRFAPGGQVQTQLGVTEQFPFNHFSFAAETNNAKGVFTGIAFAYPTFDYAVAQPQDLIITLFDEVGVNHGSKTVRLDPGKHRAQFLHEPDLFPELGYFKGTVSVSSPDRWFAELPILDGRFGILALRLEGLALGSVAINDGAVLAPYLVDASPTAETENNDHPAMPTS